MELFDTLVKAKQNIDNARAVLDETEKEWNRTITRFVEENFPDPVTVNYYGSSYTGVVRAKRYVGFALAEVRFFPITKSGQLAKNALSSTVSAWEINMTKDADDLKNRIIKNLGIVTTESDNT